MTIASRLRSNTIDDAEFDRLLYPDDVRTVSSTCWTPIQAARRAAELLSPADCILDIGSGVGKFCIVTAALTQSIVVGVERHESLVKLANEATNASGVLNARYIHGELKDVETFDFDGVYMFNPFQTNDWERDVDGLTRERYLADIASAQELLERAHTGTRVVTYLGFGGEMPSSYKMEVEEDLPLHGKRCIMRLWVQSERAQSVEVQSANGSPAQSASGSPAQSASSRHRPLHPRVTAAPSPATADTAMSCVERFCKFPSELQARIGLDLHLISIEETRANSSDRIAEFIFCRARDQGTMLKLMELIDRYAGMNRSDRRKALRTKR